MNKQPENTICLWYEKDVLSAAEFYAATFPDSMMGVIEVARSAKRWSLVVYPVIY